MNSRAFLVVYLAAIYVAMTGWLRCFSRASLGLGRLLSWSDSPPARNCFRKRCIDLCLRHFSPVDHC